MAKNAILVALTGRGQENDRRRSEEEAAWPHHRFEFRPGGLGVPAPSQKLVHVWVEVPQLPLEGFGNFLERFVGRQGNVAHRERRGFWQRQSVHGVIACSLAQVGGSSLG